MPRLARSESFEFSNRPALPAEPVKLRLTYEDAVVMAVVEQITADQPTLILQYMVQDDAHSPPEVWSALLTFDTAQQRWRFDTPDADRAHRDAIASVCADALQALGASTSKPITVRR